MKIKLIVEHNLQTKDHVILESRYKLLWTDTSYTFFTSEIILYRHSILQRKTTASSFVLEDNQACLMLWAQT